MRIRVLRSARKTIMTGFWFYENQESGLGRYFIDSIMSDLRSLDVSGGIHQIAYGRYHRMVCKTFPFSVFYRFENSEVTVHAVLDDRRDPKLISEHLN